MVGSSAIDQLGLGAQRQGNRHALAHAARELVRVLRHALLGMRDFHLFQQRQGAGFGFLLAHRQVGADGFDQVVAHGVDRVQAGQRVLEDGADALAADAAQVFALQVVDAQALQLHRAAGDAARGLDQAGDGRAGHGLAGAGFTDHAQDFAGEDVEGDVVQRVHGALVGVEGDAEVAHAQHGGAGDITGRHGLVCVWGHVHCSLGFRASRSQSPTRFTDRARASSTSEGNSRIHHSPENKKLWPMRISVPSEGAVGGRPTPR